MQTDSPPTAMQRLLAPRSIAIIGASADPRSFGGFVLGNLERFAYPGAVHLVSRSSDVIGERACVRQVADLPSDIDLAVLAIPEAGVLQAVTELAAKRCHAAVLFAAGYAETGDDGRVRQQQLVAAAGAMLVVGPNCMGFTNYAAAVPVTFEPLLPLPAVATAAAAPLPIAAPGLAAPTVTAAAVTASHIGVIAQSGFMAATLRDAFIGRGLPLSCVFSTGNEGSVGIEDVLEHQLADDSIGVVAMYAEQIRQPRRFLQLARQARHCGKPIVLLMPGKSERARDAAQSHTGALAGNHASACVALRRQAVVVVDTLDELFDTCAVLLRHPRPGCGGTAFVTGSGAMKNIALDFADAMGLALPRLTEGTVQLLKSQLPSFAVAENPLDYTTIGVRQPGLIGEIVHTVANDPHIASLVLCIPAGPEMAQRDKALHIVPALARVAKPALLVITGDDGPIHGFFTDAIRASGVPLFRSADRALRALGRVAAHAHALQRAERADRAGRGGGGGPEAALHAGDSLAPNRPIMATPTLPSPAPANGIYAEHQGKRWLAACGIPVPAGALARSADEAASIAARVGYPVVLKAQASTLPHKSDVGGVAIGLADEAALCIAWQTMLTELQGHRPDLTLATGLDGLTSTPGLEGLLVETMAPRGIELVVGAKRDADWGPVLLVGLGGVWIEALQDVRLLSADLAEADIMDELRQLKAAALLQGLRGAPGADLAAIARVVSTIGQQMLAHPQIMEIDINPLLAYPDKVLALDALVVVAPAHLRSPTPASITPEPHHP